jgi:hypothetical protein
MKEMGTACQSKNLNEKEHLGDVCVDVKTILKRKKIGFEGVAWVQLDYDR